MRFHLISNAHLDPVWLWDWREGLNQGLITCRTILDLMDECPELRFNRGEAAIYSHIEQTDPETFDRIRRYVQLGRWDVVGGTWIQPDENLPATETLVRQYVRGQRYFTSRFGRPVQVAWSADCFGHTPGMPEILAAAGIRYFSFTRPLPNHFPLARPAFWWLGAGGARILVYRPLGEWYGVNRHQMAERLDQTLKDAAGHGLDNVAIFYGLGDHGGGPTRRHIVDAAEWARAHPEIEVVHSTMHRFFDELQHEVDQQPEDFLPAAKGELSFSERGCYSSVARFKFQYRKAEAILSRAEMTQAAVALQTEGQRVNLADAWDKVLFNAFHDILPGTSIERAYDDQLAQVGLVHQQALAGEHEALNALAMQVDTRVLPAGSRDLPTGVAFLVWNSLPRPFRGFVDFEGCLDDRPIQQYMGKAADVPVRILDHRKRPLPFQKVAPDAAFWPEAAWRVHAVVPVSLPPMGWSVLEMGYAEGAPAPAAPPDAERAIAWTADASAGIRNGQYEVQARKGARGIQILRNGQPFLQGEGLSATVWDDPWGSWGRLEGGAEGADVTQIREQWQITELTVLEQGPWRAALWVRLAGHKSRIDLTFHLYAGRDAVDVSARVLWDERSARLRLVFPVGGKAEFDVPGGRAVRGPKGEVFGRCWLRLADGSFGLATDALSSFNVTDSVVQATVVRASRFADSQMRAADAEPWMPATDCGELKFRFIMAPGDDRLVQLADQLERPLVATLVPAKPGALPAQGSLMALEPETLDVLAFKMAEDGEDWVLRVRETTGRTVVPRLTLVGEEILLPSVPGNRITTYRISRTDSGFEAVLADAAEVVRETTKRLSHAVTVS